MVGIEEAYCNAAIKAVLQANRALLDTRIDDALAPAGRTQGKLDTLALDTYPEIAIEQCLQSFDQYSVLITEELGKKDGQDWFGVDHNGMPRTFFVCDPTDRSRQMGEFLNSHDVRQAVVRDLILSPEARHKWESKYGSPAEITGAFCAITCVRRGLPFCSVLLNYITQQLFVACSAGLLYADVPEKNADPTLELIDLSRLRSEARIVFRKRMPTRRKSSIDHYDRFVTFLGKQGYRENFLDSKLVSDDSTMLQNSLMDEPGGPSRILYLSALQPDDDPFGFIVANGEKIGEWIHWLPFARYARIENEPDTAAVRVFEVQEDRPWTKEGILMSTSPTYSVFRSMPTNKVFIDVVRLQALSNPSQYRATLLVTKSDNDRILNKAHRFRCREILFSLD